MFARVRPRVRLMLVVSAAAGMIIAIWLTAQLSGWDENRVVEWIPESAVLGGVVIVALLIADTVLPVPATIVMLGSGVLLGPVGGAAVNGVGLLLAAAAGYGIGRFIPGSSDEHRAMRPVLIAATRGLPVLSESFAIGAGVIGMPATQFFSGAASGAVAVGALYALAGALASDHWSLVLVAGALAAGSYGLAMRLVRAR